MSVERNNTISFLALNGLATNSAALDKAGEYRKALLSSQNYEWSQIKSIVETEDLITQLARELIDLVKFAREFGLGDYEIVKTVVDNVSAAMRPRLLSTMEPDFNLSPEEKVSLFAPS